MYASAEFAVFHKLQKRCKHQQAPNSRSRPADLANMATNCADNGASYKLQQLVATAIES